MSLQQPTRICYLTSDAEEELHEKAHIDYTRVAIVSTPGSSTTLENGELTNPCQIPNPSVAALYEDALVYETGTAITSSGALSAYSGKKTGRSPLDKRVVKEPGSENDIWYVSRLTSSYQILSNRVLIFLFFIFSTGGVLSTSP